MSASLTEHNDGEPRENVQLKHLHVQSCDLQRPEAMSKTAALHVTCVMYSHVTYSGGTSVAPVLSCNGEICPGREELPELHFSINSTNCVLKEPNETKTTRTCQSGSTPDTTTTGFLQTNPADCGSLSVRLLFCCCWRLCFFLIV